MHTVLVALISVLFVLGIMVLVHEFGHFVAAKLFGVRVEQFSIGFPPRLIGFQIGETDYCISAIPLGGYVKMTGETLPGENMALSSTGDSAAIAQDPGALTSHPRWQRIIIGAAGPCANFILALGLMTGFYMLHNEVPLYEDRPVTIDFVIPDSNAAHAGLLAGDQIVSYDNKANPTWEQVFQQSAFALSSLGSAHSLPLVALRNGQRVPLNIDLGTLAKGEELDLRKIGIYPAIQDDPVKVNSVNPGSPADKAGIQPGDQLLTIDGHVFHGLESIIPYLQAGKGAPLNIILGRNGARKPVTVTPQFDTANPPAAWRIGFKVVPPPYRVEQLPLPRAIAASVKFNAENSLLILEVVKRLVTHKMSVSTLSGPIGIAQQTGLAAETPGWEPKFKVMTAISLNLGILNLMPFPILDGGMILFLIIEMIIGHDVDMRVKERIYQVGFVLILIFFAYVIFNDISKLPIFAGAKP
jgi:regulator of sigma E protease